MTRDIDDSVNRRTVLKTAGATGVTAGLGGCSALFGGDGDDGGDGDGGGGDGAATTDEQISSDPLSAGLLSFTKGPAAVLGLQAVRGAEKAVEMINANGGIAGTRQVNLDVRDEGDNPLDKYQSFIDSGMDVTFGPISSGTHKQLAPNVESNEVDILPLACPEGDAQHPSGAHRSVVWFYQFRLSSASLCPSRGQYS